MKFLPAACMLFIAIAVLAAEPSLAKKSPRRGTAVPGRVSSKKSSKRIVRREYDYDDEDDDDDDDEEEAILGGFDADDLDADQEEDEEDEYDLPKRKRSSSKSRGRQPSRTDRSKPARRPPPARYDDEDDFEEDYDEPPPRRTTTKSSTSRRRRAPDDYDEPPRRGPNRNARGRTARRGPPPRGGRGHVVPYTNKPSTFTRGLTALRDSLPDPNSVREAALSSISAARESTSRLSTNFYRDIKGLTSSELEQVMLKATRPDDESVQGRHVERLVGVTYQISSRFDIYDAVLRKLWGKIAEKDWRTKMKALYILHRFSADGSPEHRAALKARLRELRRTKDPKRKDKYYNSRQLLSGETTPANAKYRAFMSRYAHYVLLRTQCFGGPFSEIATEPKPSKKTGKVKPVTSTCLRRELLDAAKMVLKAGTVCYLKEGEDCDHTAIAVERVVNDMINLSTAIAGTLNKVLAKSDSMDNVDPDLIKEWCEFYSSDVLPKTRSMLKKTTKKLDGYDLYLPSRVGVTVSQELLQKGLNPVTSEDGSEEKEKPTDDEKATESKEEENLSSGAVKGQDDDNEEEEEENGAEEQPPSKKKAAVAEPEEDDEDEYDFEEEYYDDEDEE
eukprot:CAMPEP_0202478884 /NCGR_PEP_ID=MMETSP1360-20130828/94694_1 /ASSEMBLY_ACC=CAM_ASM_000848 /TAXON_ID=515479 /ORGANISM="Licmophora paradoxa, Strain CCMP2313" /LENGTH=616 /DNA_ID=CAMNT_0049106183 /DNA_START=151 /DNA_END=2001 /DNA_ORIENTATION=-